MIRILAISGSLRGASSNTALIHAFARIAPAGVEVMIFNRLDQLPFFNPDSAPSPEVLEFQAAVGSCDGVVISSPEYAHGVPGVLKNALDWLVGSGEFVAKPVAVLNASERATHAWNSLVETLTVMSACVLEDASITVPLDGSRLSADAIAADPRRAAPLREVLTALMNVKLRAPRAADPDC